jgi:hypothetical protein
MHVVMQAFAPDAVRAQSVLTASLSMAAASLTFAAPISLFVHRFGRVKLQIPVAVLMPTVLVILAVDEWWSHSSAFYYVVACIWAFCDSCLHVTVAGRYL